MIFPYDLGIIIPIDVHIFQRGLLNHQPVSNFHSTVSTMSGLQLRADACSVTLFEVSKLIDETVAVRGSCFAVSPYMALGPPW